MLYNNADTDDIFHYGMTQAIVNQNGDVHWVPPTSFQAYCAATVDYTNWPNDIHQCSLELGSWTHHGNKLSLDFMEPKIQTNQMHPNPNWSLLGQIQGMLLCPAQSVLWFYFLVTFWSLLGHFLVTF